MLQRWLSLVRYLVECRTQRGLGAEEIRRLVGYREAWSCSRSDAEAAADWIRDFADFLTPTWPKGLVRIGSETDGGYLVMDPEQYDFVLSGGAGDNIDFEREMTEFVESVAVFDPFVSGLGIQDSVVRWYPIGLGEIQGGGRVRSLSVAAAADYAEVPLGLRTLVKLDIEGSEWSCLGPDLRNVGQIILELHDFHRLCDARFRQMAREKISELESRFVVVASHANNARPMFSWEGWAIPDTFEITLVNKKFVQSLEPGEPWDLPDNIPSRGSIPSEVSRVVTWKHIH